MSDQTSITPFQAATMADAVYALKDNTMEEAQLRVDFTGKGAAAETSGKMMGTSGALSYRPSSGFGYCAQSSNGKEAFVVTKGTSPCIADVLTDLDAIPMSTGLGNTAAGGFVKTFKSMELTIQEYISAGSYNTIHCIGHSLGGAIATLVANKYSQGNQKNVKLYTFGAPRVFFGTEQQLANVDSYRVYHQADPVPMLGPFPLMHHDSGMGVGSGMSVCNPFKHAMASYIQECGRNDSWGALRGQVGQPSGIVDKSKAFLEGGASWMFRALQHLVTYGISVLGLAVGGVAFSTYTAVDILFKLLQKGLSKLSSWIIALLRCMSKFIKNGWESAKAKASDAYYKSKSVILYIINQFLVKMKLLARKAIDASKSIVGSSANALRTLAPILGASYAAMPPILFL
jgi:esterase/lipase